MVPFVVTCHIYIHLFYFPSFLPAPHSELLDKVHSELQSVMSPSIVRTPSGHLWKTKQMIDLNFEGGLVSQVTCMKCKFKSNTFEPFWDLSLEFPERYDRDRDCLEENNWEQ